MPAKLDGQGKVLVFVNEDWRAHAGSDRVLIWSLELDGDDDEVVCLPQLGIEVDLVGDDEDAVARAVQEAFRRAVEYYRALIELPESYINEVEAAQLNLFHTILFPWFSTEIASKPGSWTVPDDLVPTGQRGRSIPA